MELSTLPCELLVSVLQHAVAAEWPFQGGLAGLAACRAVSRRWCDACACDEVVAAAATQLSGQARFRKLLLASDDECHLAPFRRRPTYCEAMAVIGAMRSAPEGPAVRRIAAKAARRERKVLAHPPAVAKAVKRRARLIQSSLSRRNRLPLLRAYDKGASDWRGWWSTDLATHGAAHALRTGIDPFLGTHIDYLHPLTHTDSYM